MSRGPKGSGGPRVADVE